MDFLGELGMRKKVLCAETKILEYKGTCGIVSMRLHHAQQDLGDNAMAEETPLCEMLGVR